jgi:hypothetical protein
MDGSVGSGFALELVLELVSAAEAFGCYPFSDKKLHNRTEGGDDPHGY